VTSLKTSVAKSLTSHLWEFLATLDERRGCLCQCNRWIPGLLVLLQQFLESATQMQILCIFHEYRFPDVAYVRWKEGTPILLSDRGCSALSFYLGRIRIESWSRDHLVGILTRLRAERLRNRSSVPGKFKTIFAPSLRLDRLWSPPNHVFNGHGNCFLGVTWPKGEADHTSLYQVPRFSVHGAIPPLTHTSSWRVLN
jgi:hypothetical protein